VEVIRMIWGIDGNEWTVLMAAAFGMAVVRASLVALLLAAIHAVLDQRGESSIAVPHGAS
jgi:hypothetical protein